MNELCPKCGSTEILPKVPVVAANVENPLISTLTYKNPNAHVFKGAVTHRFLAWVCGACGYTEFYVEDPKGLAAILKQTADLTKKVDTGEL